MDYNELSKEEVIEKVQELEMLVKELLEEDWKETSLDFSWSGNLGHWYWNVKTNSVVFNPLKVSALGYEKNELPEQVTYQFFTDRLHPEDFEETMLAMKKHMRGEIPVYEVEYRIQDKEGKWKWFYDRGKITQRGPHGEPLFAAGIVFDITERKLKEKNLEEKSILDELTGIRNRRSIMEELKNRMEDAIKHQVPLSIAMLDIDFFKKVNDTKGHVFGDQVLKETARSIGESIRGIDALGRYGGEEFLVIFPNTTKRNAFSVCERIRKNIESTDMGEGVFVTISGGLAEFNDENMEEFISRADASMYQAKEAGRNQIK